MIFIIRMFAYLLIFIAMDIKRTEECKVILFSSDWWLQLIFIVIAGTILEI